MGNTPALETRLRAEISRQKRLTEASGSSGGVEQQMIIDVRRKEVADQAAQLFGRAHCAPGDSALFTYETEVSAAQSAVRDLVDQLLLHNPYFLHQIDEVIHNRLQQAQEGEQ